MNTNIIEKYRTSHLPLAAFLALNNCQIAGVDNDNGKGVFEFFFVPRTLIDSFNRSAGSVEPNAYAMKLSQLTQTAKRVISERRGI